MCSDQCVIINLCKKFVCQQNNIIHKNVCAKFFVAVITEIQQFCNVKKI